MLAISNLKDGKSPGFDGWKHQELRMLPRKAIEDLVGIVNAILPFGLHPDVMKAKTTLLAKISMPTSMDHGRPITVLGTIYRLISKVLYQQIVPVWSQTLPVQISGGLPGRSVRDLALMQSTCIEDALVNQLDLTGSTMDLTKAFNLIPRRPLRILLSRLGVPLPWIDFWLINLSKLSRALVHQGNVGSFIPSTCGVPEGDALSILAMISISVVFYFKVVTVNLQAFSFADNWAWVSKSTRDQFRAWVAVRNLLHFLRMRLSVKKSWIWASTKRFRTEAKALNCLFTDTDDSLEIKHFAKDLGEIAQYNKKQVFKPLKDKLEEAKRRFARLAHLSVPLQTKLHIIQTSIWPMALYGVDLHFIGKSHFQELRKGVVQIAAGGKHKANPFLACSVLSKTLQDPLLFVLVSAIRVLRRMMTFQPDLVRSILSRAIAFNGKTTFGPATSLKRYLKTCHLDVCSEGNIKNGHKIICNVFTSSCKQISVALRLHWDSHILQTQVQRKGIDPNQMYNLQLTRKLFTALSTTQQKLITLNMIGGYQTNCVKSKWLHESVDTCELCGQPDTTGHRFTTCSALAHIRDKHRTCQDLLRDSPNWIYHPFATDDVRTHLLNTLKSSLKAQEPDFHNQPGQTCHVYFTDGGCLHPTFEPARFCSWAVVRDCAPSHDIALAAAVESMERDRSYPFWHCVGCGSVPGSQTIVRAELFAVCEAVQNSLQDATVNEIRIYTDSAYVIKIAHLIQSPHFRSRLHLVSNADLVLRLHGLCQQVMPSFFKVKSHQDLKAISSPEQLWQAMGNAAADKIATQTLNRFPHQMLNDLAGVKQHHDLQTRHLGMVLEFFADNNLERHKLLLEHKQGQCPAVTQPCEVIVEQLSEYTVLQQFAVELPEITVEVAQCNLIGTPIAYAVYQWIRTLQWPAIDESNNFCVRSNDASHAKKGISWLELSINFVITTNQYFPVRTAGVSATSKFADYNSDEAKMLPKNYRAVSKQIFTFQAVIRCMISILGTEVWPSFAKPGQCSLASLGYNGHMMGLSPRPSLYQQRATMEAARQYIVGLEGSKSLFKSLDLIRPVHSLLIPDVFADILPSERFTNYQKLKKRQRNG
eukprot:Skav205465  [mRNA]  locus=scaffold4885:270761:274054:+ [translate_table: standard]